MDKGKKTGNFLHGSVKISNDIILQIACIAAKEVEGVYSIEGLAPGETVVRSKKLPSNLGIQLEIKDDIVDISIEITVKYSFKVIEVAQNVQQNVKEQIEIMTGLKVRNVNVSVRSVK
jgi:uncharacterized alkaline shock family protein YloU